MYSDQSKEGLGGREDVRASLYTNSSQQCLFSREWSREQ